MSSNQSSPQRQPLSPSDERALYALLDEISGHAPAPPDLCEAILRDIARIADSSAPIVVTKQTGALEPASRHGAPARRGRRKSLLPVFSIVAFAAAVLFAVTLGGPFASGLFKSEAQVASKQLEPPRTPADQKPSPSPALIAQSDDPATSPEDKKSAVREGVPLVRRSEEPAPRDGRDSEQAPSTSVAVDAASELETQSVVANFNASFSAYWASLGIEPTEALSDAEWAEKVRSRFGTSPALRSDAERNQFATRWVDQLMKGVPLRKDVKPLMVADATEVLAKNGRFDELISRWVAEEKWFDANRPDVLAQSLATNLLGVDAACARCHDSPLDGQLAQHDFWSFAAIFNTNQQAPLFYEVQDGRQRVAEAQVPERWLGESALASTDNAPVRQQFARSLLNNHMLASSLANHMWQLGMGAPLVARTSDPLAPPRTDALQASHRLLTDAVMKSGFNLRTVAEVVMTSAPMRRGTLEFYQSGEWKIADKDETAKAIQAQRAFAAAPTIPTRIGREQLLAVMESKLDSSPKELKDSTALLAQPSINEQADSSARPATAEKPTLQDLAWSEWLVESERLEGSWFHRIKDIDQQRRHAVYASDSVGPAAADELALRLSETGESTAEDAARRANERLFWVLRKSR